MGDSYLILLEITDIQTDIINLEFDRNSILHSSSKVKDKDSYSVLKNLKVSIFAAV